jgi:hypothetical protein
VQNTAVTRNLLIVSLSEAAVRLACSPVLSGTARDMLKEFFVVLQGALSLDQGFKELKDQLLAAAESAPRPALRSVAECITAMCVVSEGRVESTLRECISVLQHHEESVVSSAIPLVFVSL